MSIFKRKKVKEEEVKTSDLINKAKDNVSKEKRITSVMEKTGWDRETAEKNMKAAKAAVGINFKDYDIYNFHKVDEKNWEEEYEKVKRRKEQRKREKAECIKLAMEKKGWSKLEAEKHLASTRKRTGISYREYRRFYFFDIPDDKQVERYEEIKAGKDARKERHGNENDKFTREINEITGWSEEEILKKMRKAKANAGATFKDYYAFRFWEIDEKDQVLYFTQKQSNKLSKKYDTNAFHRDILLNKELSCKYFSQFLKRSWCINRDISLDEFKEIFKEDKKVVYKPLDGNGGHGIKVLSVEDEKINETFESVMSFARGVVEGFVVQHEKMKTLAPNSVNTVRIVTISSDVEEGSGKEIDTSLVYAALRVGSGTSCVDNFTDGGLVVGVNLETGVVETNGVTIDGKPFEKHPDTGTVFKGFEIPYFEEAKALVLEAGKTISGYLGWDVAIAENGPVLIEANIMPGNRILQMPYVEDRIGKMELMAKYL